MKKIVALDVKYSLIQVLYCGSYCSLLGYASVYLLANGISNAVIGIVLALISIFIVCTQPMVASYADKNKQVELRTIINSILVIAVVASMFLYVFNGIEVLLLCLFVGITTLVMTLQPILNSLAFTFEKYGIEVNYGVARGLGSGAYAIVSIVLGYVVEDFGASVIPLVYIILNTILILIVYSYVIPKSTPIVKREVEVTKKVQQVSLIEFCKTYKTFLGFVLGVVIVFFTPTFINNFFIQIITPLGGNEKEMGTAFFLAAILEVPIMAMFNKIKEKINCSMLLRIAVVMFLVKHALTFLATNMMMIYIAQAFQMLSYAIFIPASVYYVNEVIASQDAIKGQSMVTMAMMGSGIIANLLGGILLDTMGVQQVLFIGVIVSLLGAMLVLITTKRKN